MKKLLPKNRTASDLASRARTALEPATEKEHPHCGGHQHDQHQPLGHAQQLRQAVALGQFTRGGERIELREEAGEEVGTDRSKMLMKRTPGMASVRA